MLQLAEEYKVQVDAVAARLYLWNQKCLDASFYLRLASVSGPGRESLGERLNDPSSRFLACRIQGRVEIVHLDALACVEVLGRLPEVEQHEQLGALRLRAALVLRCGRSFAGEFLAMLPPGRRRISDLLNVTGERFLLFVNPVTTRYIHRDAIARVLPTDGPELHL